MKYNIIILKRARKFIEKQSKDIQKRILIAIQKLPEGDTKLLKGYRAVSRLRVGNIRVIYTINDDTVTITVIDAGNRGQIYNHIDKI